MRETEHAWTARPRALHPQAPATSSIASLAARAADSDMAARILAFDWSATALGAPSGWSGTLAVALDLCLGSRMCGCIYWGPRHLLVYNDAYGSILGTKHPWALGRSAFEVWPEIIDVIGPLLRETFTHGTTTGADDAPIFINRAGYVEEFYCSFSYAPIIARDGRIEGVFATLPETSLRVIGERRLRTLQRLGIETRASRQAEHTLECAARVLRDNPCDLPFAALYAWRADASEAQLTAAVNIDPGAPLCPLRIELDGGDELARRLQAARRDGYSTLPLASRHAPIPHGAWKVPPRELVVFAISPYADDAPRALLLAGINPHKRLDDDHLEFFRLLADQIRRALAEAFSHEQEEARLRDLQERARVAQEAERVRIARDLHDTLLQSLQGLRFLLQAAIARRHQADVSADALFGSALAAAEHAIEEGREVLSLLRSTTPSAQELETALATLGGELVHGKDIAFSFALRGRQREVEAGVWNDIYGIFREAVGNAVQHSAAGLIAVTLDYADDLHLYVTDDGRGFDPAAAALARRGHFGLQGMRERAANLAADFELTSAPGAGTRIAIRVAGSRAYCA